MSMVALEISVAGSRWSPANAMEHKMWISIVVALCIMYSQPLLYVSETGELAYKSLDSCGGRTGLSDFADCRDGVVNPDAGAPNEAEAPDGEAMLKERKVSVKVKINQAVFD